MSDLTVYAETLIATVARAFYDDDAVCLIDVLLRDKFLRDDDMGPRLSLPAKQLRRTLQFLQNEHLVRFELVDDLSYGGSQATKFWYIDYNHAVNTIRLRIFLLRKQLQEAEMQARSSSFYLCPNYSSKKCNGRYTEEQAQQVLDSTTGLFLCQECVRANVANPNPPPLEMYTLQLVDNSRALKSAMDNLRRVNVQLSGKVIGNDPLRAGTYDLLQKVRGKGKGPLTSNLPSENFALGIGSKRLTGTGRTAGIKAKKLAKQGVTTDNSVGRLLGGTNRTEEGADWLFLKNAMGQELALEVEKGGAARANILATRRRRQGKLLDAAASRIGVQVPLSWKMKEKRKREREARKAAKKKKRKGPETLEFLNNNIGRTDNEDDGGLQEESDDDEDGGGGPGDEKHGIWVVNDTEEWLSKTEDDRRAIFQAQYKIEVGRQMDLLQSEKAKGMENTAPPSLVADEEEYRSIPWEDC